jgi:hypothetical protein
MSLFAAPHSPTVKGNASGGRGAAPDPAGGNHFPRTPSVGFRLRVSTWQHSRHPFAGSRYEAGAGGLALWAEPTCDQIGFDKMRIADSS